jgi:hypothetical protein
MCVEVLQDDELRALQDAFERACIQLGLSKEDDGRREHLAMLMLSAVEQGATDVDAILKQAAFRLQHPH